MVNLGNEQHSMSIRQPMTTNAYYFVSRRRCSSVWMGIFNHNALQRLSVHTISSMEVVKGPVSSILWTRSCWRELLILSAKTYCYSFLLLKLGINKILLATKITRQAGAHLGNLILCRRYEILAKRFLDGKL